MITDLSASLLAVAPAQLTHAVERALERVRLFFRADRCALVSVSADGERAFVRLATYAEGVPQVSAEIDLAPAFPWSRRQLLVERVPVRVPTIDDLPLDAETERASWLAMPIRSALAVPIETAGAIRHLIIIQTVYREREWPEAFVPRLRVLGEMLVGALEREILSHDFQMSEARLASAADLAGLAFYEVDFVAATMFTDVRLRDLCGMPDDLGQGVGLLRYWVGQIHPDDRARVLEQREQLHDGRTDRISTQYRYLHPSRGELWIQHEARVAQRAADGTASLTFGVLRDITDRMHVEDELRDLSRRLIRAHEEERALLARELHDDVTQRLAVLAIDLGRAEIAATDEAHAAPMRSIREDIVRLSEDIHSLAYQLHPSVLVELGLAEALRAECERRARQGRVDVTLALDPLPDGIGGDAALCLFRIAQEALNNVTRHSGVRAAGVRLRQIDGGVLVAVRDEGVGFDAGSPGRQRSLGLASMRERVRLVNGTLDVESAPGQGTTVIAWVPLAETIP